MKDVRPIIKKYAFAESFPAIEAAVKEERWQVIRPDGVTAVQHLPVIPLTLLERQWLKAVSLDPRIRLFDFDFGKLDDVEPLFTPDDYYIFDKYGDADYNSSQFFFREKAWHPDYDIARKEEWRRYHVADYNADRNEYTGSWLSAVQKSLPGAKL